MDRLRLRRPEYTGANRCRACTAVNAAVLLVAVGLAWLHTPATAAVVGVIGVATIALRGYLIPFTPRFAPALVDPLPGDLFDHTAPAASDALSELESDGRGPEAILRGLADAKVVVTDGDHLTLRPAFASTWRDRMAALADASDDRLTAAARDAIPAVDAARIEHAGSETFLVVSGEASTGWIRRPVAIAEVAAAGTLGDTDLPAASRGVAADALCAFLETCPVCGDDVVEGSLTDCCGHTLGDPTRDPPQGLACETCEVAFHRFE